MFWNKKENKGVLPDLPPLVTPRAAPSSPSPTLFHDESDETDDLASEKHTLPAFPDSPLQKGFSQAAIKDAITSTESDEDLETISPEPPKSFTVIEMEDDSVPASSIREHAKLPPPPELPSSVEPLKILPRVPQRGEKNRDIYIKIDKFISSRRAVDALRKQLDQMDDLLKKIRETKMREEQELAAWEKELAHARARMRDVHENIFEKID